MQAPQQLSSDKKQLAPVLPAAFESASLSVWMKPPPKSNNQQSGQMSL
jgi:hypothetical protein